MLTGEGVAMHGLNKGGSTSEQVNHRLLCYPGLRLKHLVVPVTKHRWTLPAELCDTKPCIPVLDHLDMPYSPLTADVETPEHQEP